jgi:transcriptional regulator with XRE-family HTH domain
MPHINETAKAWELGLSERFGVAVKARRTELGLTAGQLAELCDALGFPVHRVAITKIETNARAGKLDVAELVALAEALQMAPLELLFGGPPDQSIDYLPDQPTSVMGAAIRFTRDLPHQQVAAISAQLNQIAQAVGPLSGHGDLSKSTAIPKEATK